MKLILYHWMIILKIILASFSGFAMFSIAGRNNANGKEKENRMNVTQRQSLEKIKSSFEGLISELETIRDENQESFDNMPEGLQNAEKGEAMQSAIDALESAIGDATTALDNIDNAIVA